MHVISDGQNFVWKNCDVVSTMLKRFWTLEALCGIQQYGN